MIGVHHHPVADRNGVFNNNEQPRDHVLYQLLRTKADCQPDHPGTGKKGRDVDPQIGHGSDGTHHHQNHFDRVAQQRQDGLGAGAWLPAPPSVNGRLQGLLDRGIEHHPGQPRHQQNQ